MSSVREMVVPVDRTGVNRCGKGKAVRARGDRIPKAVTLVLRVANRATAHPVVVTAASQDRARMPLRGANVARKLRIDPPQKRSPRSPVHSR